MELKEILIRDVETGETHIGYSDPAGTVFRAETCDVARAVYVPAEPASENDVTIWCGRCAAYKVTEGATQ